MANLEFQVAGEWFEQTFRERLKADARFCAPGPLPLPNGVILDRVAVTGTTTLRRAPRSHMIWTKQRLDPVPVAELVPGEGVQVAQDVELRLVTLASLASAAATPGAEPDAIEVLPLTLIFQVTLGTRLRAVATEGLDLALEITYAGFTSNSPRLADPEVRRQLDETLQKTVPRIDRAIDRGQFTPLLQEADGIDPKTLRAPTVSNAALILMDAPAGSGPPTRALVMRIQFGGFPETIGIWNVFARGPWPNLLRISPRGGTAPTADSWAARIDASIIEQQMEARIADWSRKAGGKVRLSSGPFLAWSAEGGRAQVIATLVMETPGPDIDVTIVVDLSAPGAGRELVTSLQVTAANTAWTAGLRIFSEEDEAFVLFSLAGLPDPRELVVGLLTEVRTPTQTLPSGCTKISPLAYVCRRPFRGPKGPLLEDLELLDFVGDDTGLVLVGRQPRARGFRNATAIVGDVRAEIIPVIGGCDAEPRIVYRAEVQVLNRGTEDRGGETQVAPLVCCSVETREDPLNVFAPRVDRDPEGNPIRVWVELPYDVLVASGYFSGAYPWQFIVRTSGGVRLVRVPPVAELSRADIDRLMALGRNIRDRRCTGMADWASRRIRRFELGPDPETFRERAGARRWLHVSASGLEPGERVRLVSSDTVLAEAQVGAGGTLELGSFTSVRRDRQLALVHDDDGRGASLPMAGAADRPRARIQVVRNLLAPRGQIPFDGAPRSLESLRMAGATGIVLVGDGGLQVHRLGAEPVIALAEAGWAGATRFGGRLLLWGEDGFGWLGPDATVLRRPGPPVRAAALVGDQLYALTPRGIESFGSRLERHACHTELDGTAVDMASAGGSLLVAGECHVDVHDVSRPHQPWKVARHPVSRVARLRRCVLSGLAAPVLVERACGSAVLLDVADPTSPREVACYPEVPWFARALTPASIFGLWEPSNGLVLLYQLEASSAIG